MAQNKRHPEKGKPCNTVTLPMAKQMIQMSEDGWLQCRIAAAFDVNQGRVSEVIRGRKFPEAQLPPLPSLFD